MTKKIKNNERNIHKLFESFLIRENYLTEKKKSEYLELFEKIQKNEIEKGLITKFQNEINFDADYYLSPLNSIVCYGTLIEQKQLLNNQSWQYQVGLEINHFETYGINSNTEHLKNAVRKIPDEKFNKIYYRQLFISLLYTSLKNLGKEKL